MKFDLNKFAFVCLKTSGGNIYPPQDIGIHMSKEVIYNHWKNYIQNDYPQHKKMGMYIHTPFCEAKCVFCCCGSEKVLGGNTLEKYLEKIIAEMKFFSPIFHEIKLNHAYFGGGTPSIYNPTQLEKLLRTIREIYAFENDAQFNFEVSPHTITEEKIKILKKYGVSRVTIGIQTMTEKSLDFNNRTQSWDKLESVFSWIRKHNIEHINVDLMPGIPGENLRDFLLNLKRIISLNPDMIHLYPFRPTEETLFSKNGFTYSKNDIRNRDLMYEMGAKLIEKSGFHGIENDSWGKKDLSRNEQEVDKIVNNCSILGFGYPTRSYIHKNLMYFTGYEMYKEEEPEYVGIELTPRDYISRYLISHFRSGFNIDEFNLKFSADFLSHYKEEINFLEKHNIATIQDNFFKTNIQTVFEKLLYSKVFYSNNNIDIILNNFGYDEKKDYINLFKDTLSIAYK